MLALRCEGFSLAAIGRRFGVSRQRVDQIIRASGGVEVGRELTRARRAREVRARRELHARLARERSEEILERYRAGNEPQAIARELGLQHEVVKGLIAARRTDSDRAARATALQRAGRPRYSDAELIDGVRLVAQRVGLAPTCEQYDRVSRELGLASLPTVYMRFGSWSCALRAAGLEPRRAPIRKARWSLAACWRAVESVADQLGDPPRIRRYVELAAGRDDLPSAAMLRARLGLWSEIAAVLVEQRSQHGQAPAESVNEPASDGHGQAARLPSQLGVNALRYLAEHPDSSGRAVGRGLGMRHDSQGWALLHRLERDGLLAKRPGGRSSAWTLTDHGRRLLHELPEGTYA